MNAAPRSAEDFPDGVVNLLLVVPNPYHHMDTFVPCFIIESGQWNEDASRWEGEWRHYVDEEEAGTPRLCVCEPVAWAFPPAVPAHIIELARSAMAGADTA